jgi:putative transposase
LKQIGAFNAYKGIRPVKNIKILRGDNVMARRKRGKLPEGRDFFVTVKINREKHELKKKREKELLAERLEEVKKKYPCEIYNFTVMDNHIHILIRPLEGTCLSKLMQQLLSGYAKAWNKMNGLKTGRLWGDRFHCVMIESDEDFARIFDYISQNPVKANAVEKAGDWECSGPGHYMKGRRGILDLPEHVLALYRRYFPAPETPMPET